MYISSAKAESLIDIKNKDKITFDGAVGIVANMKMSRVDEKQGHYVTLKITPDRVLLIDTMPRRVSNEIIKKAKQLAKVVFGKQHWHYDSSKITVITLDIDKFGARSGLYAAAVSRIALKLTPMTKKWRDDGKSIGLLVREEATRLERKLVSIRSEN